MNEKLREFLGALGRSSGVWGPNSLVQAKTSSCLAMCSISLSTGLPSSCAALLLYQELRVDWEACGYPQGEQHQIKAPKAVILAHARNRL